MRREALSGVRHCGRHAQASRGSRLGHEIYAELIDTIHVALLLGAIASGGGRFKPEPEERVRSLRRGQRKIVVAYVKKPQREIGITIHKQGSIRYAYVANARIDAGGIGHGAVSVC